MKIILFFILGFAVATVGVSGITQFLDSTAEEFKTVIKETVK